MIVCDCTLRCVASPPSSTAPRSLCPGLLEPRSASSLGEAWGICHFRASGTRAVVSLRVLVHLRNCLNSRAMQLFHAATVASRVVAGRETVVAFVGIMHPGNDEYLCACVSLFLARYMWPEGPCQRRRAFTHVLTLSQTNLFLLLPMAPQTKGKKRERGKWKRQKKVQPRMGPAHPPR